MFLKLLFFATMMFIVVSVGHWFVIGYFWRKYKLWQGGRKAMSLPGGLLRFALVAGVVTSLILLYSIRGGIAFWADRFYDSPENNVILRVLKTEMGFDHLSNEGDWEHLTQKLVKRPKPGDDDQKLFNSFRETYCQDGNQIELVVEDKKLDQLFAELIGSPNAPEGFLKGIDVLTKRVESVRDDLAKHLKNRYRVGLWSWETRGPKSLAILRSMGDEKEAFKDLKSVLDQKLSDEKMGGVYEKVLLSHLDRMTMEMTPFYRAVQMVFGLIQILTLGLFFTGLTLLRFRHLMLLAEKEWNVESGPHSMAGEIELDLKLDEALKFKRNPELARDQLRRLVQRAEDRIDKTEYAVIDYIIWGMPSLGFVGTVLGIGAALGDADKVVRAVDAAAQASAITGVTSLLSVAFDTTLIALICGLPMMALVYWIRSAESRFLVHLPEELEHNGLFKRLNIAD